MRSFLGWGRKPWVPSTCAGDLSELLRMPLRSQGYSAVVRGLSGPHWFLCKGRGLHLELRQELQFSSPDFNDVGSDSDRRVPAEMGQESQASSCVEEWNAAFLSSCSQGFGHLSSCVWNLHIFPGPCSGVQVLLRVLPSSTGLPSKRCSGIGFFSRADREFGVFPHVAPPTSLCLEFPCEISLILSAQGMSGTPCTQSRGIDPPVAIRRVMGLR